MSKKKHWKTYYPKKLDKTTRKLFHQRLQHSIKIYFSNYIKNIK